jgi:tetratricopeptide (TPR) repeat protein
MASQVRKPISPLLARALVLMALLCGALLEVEVARAQSASDKAAAEALFDRGLALMRDGKYQEACERLEQSQSIDRGIGTMLYLAECYEKTGKTASAWALFREAASLAQAGGQTERADAGKRRAAQLEKGLSRLTIKVPAGSKVAGLEIQDNGTPVHPSVWGYAAPVDPGNHRIEAKAPGYLPFSKDVKVDDHAASVELEVPALTRDENAPVAVAPTAQQTASAQGEQPSGAAEPRQGRMSTQRIVGLALGGAGVVAIAVGGALGIRAIVK